jgi:hypothetical protein
VPDLRSGDVVGIFCSDVHFSLKAPLFRSAEPDWKEAMARPWSEITELQEKHGCPVIIAGDLFDRPDNPAELTNFALDVLPPCYAVPGQHDLMHHRYKDIHKTSYWTLVLAKRIITLDRVEHPIGFGVQKLNLFGFPWGDTLTPPAKTHSLALNVAVVHSYIWTPGNEYKDVPEEQRLREHAKKLTGYNASAWGDNHIGFINEKAKVCNCGSLMRRKLDEKDYKPFVGLLLEDGTWKRHFLDTSRDKFLAEEKMVATVTAETERARRFLDGLSKLHPSEFDFRKAVIRWMDKQQVSEEARIVVLACMD